MSSAVTAADRSVTPPLARLRGFHPGWYGAVMGTAIVGIVAAQGGEIVSEPLKLIPPWTPVVAKAGASGVEVGVWGRTLKLANKALPTSIVTAGEEILAAMPHAVEVRLR